MTDADTVPVRADRVGTRTGSRGSVPPKSKRREALRDKLRGSRSPGRPLDPPRSEKEARERARAKLNALSYKAAETLEKGMDDAATPLAVTAANSVLDRAGIGKTVDVHITDPMTTLLLEVAKRASAGD